MENTSYKIIKPDYWGEAISYLSHKDHIISALIRQYKGEMMVCKNPAFHTLARAIVGQQISVLAADSVWARLENACSGNVNPQNILKVDTLVMRALGLFNSKKLCTLKIALNILWSIFQIKTTYTI